ncbi:MAG: DNA integrity scanning diadenylate cyclase DisA [Terriglobia bacterium]
MIKSKFKNRKAEQLLIEALETVAPGTELREALEYINKAGTGALIVIGSNPSIQGLSNGGFDLDCPFRAQRLFELAKMDGAIILTEDCRKIAKANVHLVPSSDIPTRETGIRHRTAERVAKQANCLVVSISQRRDLITVHTGALKYTLEDIRTVLTKANQALQTLERYKFRLQEVSAQLSSLEFEGYVTLVDVAEVLQKAEMVKRVGHEIEAYISELGTEARLIEMQLDDMMTGVEEDCLMTIKDYCHDRRQVQRIAKKLGRISEEDLLSATEICLLLGYKDEANLLDQPVQPRGFRLL